MSVLNAQSVDGKVISKDIFGVIILATLDQLSQGETFEDVADTIGLQSLRYSEGSLTEHYFDLTDSGGKTVTNVYSNDQINFLPYSEFMQYAKTQ